MIRKIISLIFLVAILDLANAKLDHCPDSRRKGADDCARDVFFIMDPNFKPPTEQTIGDYCKKMDKDIKCLIDYGKDCLKGFTKQSMQIGTTGFKKLYKSICTPNGSKRQEFIQRTQWIKPDDVNELYTCAAGGIRNYEYISKSVSNDEQIPQACCAYHILRSCIDKKGKKLTTADNVKFFNTLNDEALGGLIKFLCSKQDTLDTCKSTMGSQVTRMEKVNKSIVKGKRENQESILLPFLSILSD